MKTPKRSTDSELNEEVSRIQQGVEPEEQMQADPAPEKLEEPGPVPQPPLKEATKQEREEELLRQAGADPKANQLSAEEKKAFEESQKRLKGGK